MERPQRTTLQNKSLHLWLRQVSETLNDAGLDMKKTLKESVDIPWDKEGRNAKEHLWRPVMEAMTGEESTTDMDTLDPTLITDVINRHIGEKFGVTLPPWPNRFNQFSEPER